MVKGPGRAPCHLQEDLMATTDRTFISGVAFCLPIAARPVLALARLCNHRWQVGQHAAARKLMEHVARRVASAELV